MTNEIYDIWNILPSGGGCGGWCCGKNLLVHSLYSGDITSSSWSSYISQSLWWHIVIIVIMPIILFNKLQSDWWGAWVVWVGFNFCCCLGGKSSLQCFILFCHVYVFSLKCMVLSAWRWRYMSACFQNVLKSVSPRNCFIRYWAGGYSWKYLSPHVFPLLRKSFQPATIPLCLTPTPQIWCSLTKKKLWVILKIFILIKNIYFLRFINTITMNCENFTGCRNLYYFCR